MLYYNYDERFGVEKNAFRFISEQRFGVIHAR
jgi:hypothetical protein